MRMFFRANIASLSASFCDYMVTISLVQILFADKLLAGVAGTLFGGIVNFYISRYWVFKAHDIAVSRQGKRYLITWMGNLVLNTCGLYLLISLLEVQYIIAKVVTSLVVAIAYNYPVQKRYVFKLSD